MKETITCPKCGTAITIDENSYAAIVAEVRGKEFDKDLEKRINEIKEKYESEKKTALDKAESEKTTALNQAELDKKDALTKLNEEITKLKGEINLVREQAKQDAINELNQKSLENEQLKSAAALLKQEYEAKIKELINNNKNEIENLKNQISQVKQDTLNQNKDDLNAKQLEIEKLNGQIKMAKKEAEDSAKELISSKQNEINELNHKIELEQEKNKNELALAISKKEEEIKSIHQIIKEKDDLISYYKDMKAKLSTKMIGETLEVHCKNTFDQYRTLFGNNVYFEKDNDAKSGSKGDFIYREKTDDGIEVLSIMFEMKNEGDETATKHKNEDFFKELDKDRNEKNCEYAVLVTLLESDNELYNNGIVDVSYKYPKMYVIRPQFFMPLITILRNSAKNAIGYKTELERIKQENIDVTNFENEVKDFKDKFGRNYRLASERFADAIKKIDETIKDLNTVRDNLVKSENNLRLANDKAQDLSIKKLIKNNPTMQDKFKALEIPDEEEIE